MHEGLPDLCFRAPWRSAVLLKGTFQRKAPASAVPDLRQPCRSRPRKPGEFPESSITTSHFSRDVNYEVKKKATDRAKLTLSAALGAETLSLELSLPSLRPWRRPR